MTTSIEITRPNIFVIAGPNGAGKTTFATQFLPDFVVCREFLNADLIAAGLSPFAPESQNLKAGRLLLERFKELVKKRQTFGFETTLSGRTYLQLLKDAKDNGFGIHLFFLWLPEEEIAVARVANRVSQGGHNIPERDIRRRFRLGLRNLFDFYSPILDSWSILDASHMPPSVIVNRAAELEEVFDTYGYDKVKANLTGVQ